MVEPIQMAVNSRFGKKRFWINLKTSIMYGGLVFQPDTTIVLLQIVWLVLGCAIPRSKRPKRPRSSYKEAFIKDQALTSIPDRLRIGILVLGAVLILFEIGMSAYIEYGG